MKLGETFDFFGAYYAADPANTPDAKADQKFYTAFKGITSMKIEVADAEYASMYGITIDGTKITIANEAAYGKLIPFKIIYTNNTSKDDATIYSDKSFNVMVQSRPVAASVTLKAEHTLYQTPSTSTDYSKMMAYFPIEEVVNAISGDDKIAWNAAKVSQFGIVSYANGVADSELKLVSSKKYALGLETPHFLTLDKSTGGEAEEISAPALYNKDKTALASTATLDKAKYIGVMVQTNRENVTADVYSSTYQITFNGKKVYGKIELSLKNPKTLTRINSLFDANNKVVAYGEGNTGNGSKFDVTKLYNTVDATWSMDKFSIAISKEGEMTNADKAKWSTASGSSVITINKDQFYKHTPKVNVAIRVFTGAKYNLFTDEFYVTAKSPITEGTLDVNKTTLDLSQGVAAGVAFTQADFTTKDVFGDVYNLFGIYTADDATTTTNEEAFTAPSTTKISSVEISTDNSLVSVEKTYSLKDNDADTDGVADTKDYAHMTGFKLIADSAAGLSSGDTVKLTIKVVDTWGQETVKEVTLNVKK